jgi:drug/metabolite transporter (DMT)-like permease
MGFLFPKESPMSIAPGRGRLLAAFAAVYLIWGSTYLAIRVGVETLPPFLLAAVRLLPAGLILYVWERARGASRPSAAHWRSAAVIGAGLLLSGNGLVTWAEKRVPSGAAALMVATVPLWMALLPLLSGRPARLSRAQWAGLLVGFAGVGLLAGPGGGRLDLAGTGALIAASLSWAAASLYSRRAPLPASAFLGAGMEMICGGALLAGASWLSGEARGFSPAQVSARSAVCLAYLIVFGSLVGFSCYVWLLKSASPVRVSSYAYVNPVVAVALGRLLGGEALTGRTLSAAGAIVAGVLLMTAFPAGRTRPAPAVPEPV